MTCCLALLLYSESGGPDFMRCKSTNKRLAFNKRFIDGNVGIKNVA